MRWKFTEDKNPAWNRAKVSVRAAGLAFKDLSLQACKVWSFSFKGSNRIRKAHFINEPSRAGAIGGRGGSLKIRLGDRTSCRPAESLRKFETITIDVTKLFWRLRGADKSPVLQRSPKPLQKHTFWAKSLFYPSPKSGPELPPTSILDPSRKYVLLCLSSWALGRVVFSCVWGVMALKGRLVMCLGRLDRQNRIKVCRMFRFRAHSLTVDPTPGHLKSSLVQGLLWLCPRRPLELPNCTCLSTFNAPGASNVSLCWIRSTKNAMCSSVWPAKH